MTKRGRNDDQKNIHLSDDCYPSLTRDEFVNEKAKLESDKREDKKRFGGNREFSLIGLETRGGRIHRINDFFNALRLDVPSLQALKLLISEINRMNGDLSDLEEIFESAIRREEAREAISSKTMPGDCARSENNWTNKPSGKEGEPIVFSTNCIDDLLLWIPKQRDGIIGAQFHLWSEDILQAMSKVPCDIIVNEEDWMRNSDKKYSRTRRIAGKWYPKILNKNGLGGIHVLSKKFYHGDIYPTIMHQKWLLGSRALLSKPTVEDFDFQGDSWWMHQYFIEHNLVCGSFNLTPGAVKYYESLFFVDHIEGLRNSSWERKDCSVPVKNSIASIQDGDAEVRYIEEENLLFAKLQSDFDYLKNMSIPWEAYINS